MGARRTEMKMPHPILVRDSSIRVGFWRKYCPSQILIVELECDAHEWRSNKPSQGR